MMTIEEICLAMQEAERKAGELILHAKGVMTETKSGARDVVTQYDRAVQQLVIWNLRAVLPEAHFFCAVLKRCGTKDTGMRSSAAPAL